MTALLAGLRVVESSALGPGALTTHLADLGAEVIKIEGPEGDYIRRMTWPMVDGVSLLHLHVSRGKRSVVLDLRTEEGVASYLDLVRVSDVVVEAMRPGALERRGLGFDRLREANPRIVYCTISGFGLTGPYRDLPSHGIAYDAWAGVVRPEPDADGFPTIPDAPSIGIHAGPLYGALGVLAAVLRARATGEPARLEVAQSDAAAAFDWYRSETWRAYERPADEVTGNPTDGGRRRAPGTGGMAGAVRYQFYASKDGYILLQASERKFWENLCRGVGRPDLFESRPGKRYADHAVGDTDLRGELAEIFAGRTTAEWVEFGGRVDTPIAPVHDPRSLAADPQFADRLPWLPRERLGTDQLPTPVKLVDESLPVPRAAPTVGQDTDAVLQDVLGYAPERIAALRAAGVLGEDPDAD